MEDLFVRRMNMLETFYSYCWSLQIVWNFILYPLVFREMWRPSVIFCLKHPQLSDVFDFCPLPSQSWAVDLPCRMRPDLQSPRCGWARRDHGEHCWWPIGGIIPWDVWRDHKMIWRRTQGLEKCKHPLKFLQHLLVFAFAADFGLSKVPEGI